MLEASPRYTKSHSVTLRKVGRIAGASRAEAAPVASGSLRTAPWARQATQQAIGGLDRTPNRAPGRHSQRSNSVAVVVTEPTTKIFGDPFYSLLFKGIYDALGERFLLPVMLAPQSAKDLELVQAYLLQRHFDGVVLVSLHDDNQLPNRLRDAGIPAVLWGTPGRGIVASYIDSDNRQGARLAVEHLISLGHHKIAMISGNLDMTGAVGRLMGYRDALVAADITLDPTLEEVADYLSNRAQMAMERLLLNHPDVDAVFAASDLMAAAAIRVLHQAGKRIPEDVAVIGFDDSPTSLATHPPLSTVHQSIEEMGHEVVGMLMLEMEEPEERPRQVVFGTELVVRESTIGAQAMGAADWSRARAPLR